MPQSNDNERVDRRVVGTTFFYAKLTEKKGDNPWSPAEALRARLAPGNPQVLSDEQLPLGDPYHNVFDAVQDFPDWTVPRFTAEKAIATAEALVRLNSEFDVIIRRHGYWRRKAASQAFFDQCLQAVRLCLEPLETRDHLAVASRILARIVELQSSGQTILSVEEASDIGRAVISMILGANAVAHLPEIEALRQRYESNPPPQIVAWAPRERWKQFNGSESAQNFFARTIKPFKRLSRPTVEELKFFDPKLFSALKKECSKNAAGLRERGAPESDDLYSAVDVEHLLCPADKRRSSKPTLKRYSEREDPRQPAHEFLAATYGELQKRPPPKTLLHSDPALYGALSVWLSRNKSAGKTPTSFVEILPPNPDVTPEEALASLIQRREAGKQRMRIRRAEQKRPKPR